MASYADNFNRANGAIGAAWANVGGASFQIVSNEVRQQSSGGQYYAGRYESNMDSGDYSVTATIRCTDGASGVGVIGRMTASGTATSDIDGYAAFYFPGDRWYLQRLVNGQDSFGGSGVALDDYVGSTTAGTNYTVELRMSGTSIDVYIDSTLRMSATDSGLSTGRAGLMSYGGANSTNAPYYENFTAIDAAGTNATATPSAASATFAAQTPTISVSSASTATPSAAAATFAAQTPTIVAVRNVTITPAAAAATFGAQAPVVWITSAKGALRFYGNGADVNRVLIDLDDNVTDPPVDVGAGDFSYEFWFRCAYADNTTTATDEDVRYSNIILDRDIWGHARGWCLGVTRSGSDLVIGHGIAGNSWSTYWGTTDVGDDDWHFCEYSRSGSTIRVFIDGSQEFSYSYGADLSYPNGEAGGGGQFNPYLVIGCEKHDVGYYWTGQFDEFRVSDAARHTSGYTRPSAPFATDADTMALFHFDEGAGTIAYDSSGQGGAVNATLLVGGSPSGPTWVSSGAPLSGDVAVTPTAASATFAAQSVTISAGATVSPTEAAATFAAQSVTISAGATVTPSAASIIGAAQSVTVSTDAVVTATNASATWAAQSVTVSAGGSVIATPTEANATFAAQSPTVIAVQNVIVSASNAEAAFDSQSPAISTGATITVTGANATWAAQSVTVLTDGNTTATPESVDLLWVAQSPAITADSVVTSSGVSLVWTVQAPSIIIGNAFTVALTTRARDFNLSTVARSFALTADRE